MPPFFNHRVVHLTISVIVVHSLLRKCKPGGLAAALSEIMMTGYVKLQNDPDTEWRKVTYRQINRGIQIEEPNEAINYISRATADVRLDDGTLTAGNANLTGRILFE